MRRGRYTVNEVEERTKVPASTLRQWERRYGFPKPERSESGYRLYGDEDIKHINAMKSHIADGVPASRAAQLVKRLQFANEGPRPLDDLAQEFVRAMLELDEPKADAVLSEAHALHSVEAVMLELIKPAMHKIGDLWHQGQINTTSEHFASNYVVGRLRALLSLSANVQNAPAVIVACAPGDFHELGALMLAVIVRRSAYRVYFIGGNTPVEDLKELAERLSPVAVMISATSPGSAQQLLAGREHLKAIAPLLIFGGPVFDSRPDLARELGGRYLARDLQDAVKAFDQLVQDVRQDKAMRP